MKDGFFMSYLFSEGLMRAGELITKASINIAQMLNVEAAIGIFGSCRPSSQKFVLI
jgi:hypothetical protein